MTAYERLVLMALAEIIVLLADLPTSVQHIGGRPRQIADTLRRAAMEGVEDGEATRI